MSLSRKKIEIENRPNNNNNNTNNNFDSSMVWASPQTKIRICAFLIFFREICMWLCEINITCP